MIGSNLLKWFRNTPRDLIRLGPSETYKIILEELPLPEWLLEMIRQPVEDLKWTLRLEKRDEYTGLYRYFLLENSSGRTILIHVAADVISNVFSQIGNLAAMLGRFGIADRLFIFSEAPPVPQELVALKDNWFNGNVVLCLRDQIERLRLTVDPGERKELLRNWFDVPQPPLVSPVTHAVPLQLEEATREELVSVLARGAQAYFAGARQYFNVLLDLTGIDANWVNDVRMSLVASADTNARTLIARAAAEGEKGAPSGHTVLGYLLHRALSRLRTIRDEAIVVAVILRHNLITDESALRWLRTRYAVPEFTDATVYDEDIGPDIEWLGPFDDIEFQSYDAGVEMVRMDDLPKVIEQGGSVCLIKVPAVGPDRTGTGFLMAPDLVLTNCHVLLKDWSVLSEREQDKEATENAKTVEFLFRFTRGDKDQAPDGLSFKVAPKNPLVKLSPVKKLDYALLRLEKPVTDTKGLQPARWVETYPTTRSALHIIQHPRGREMSVDFNVSAITAVKPERGLLQYATQTAKGSSGSPCFNSDWKVVGLHHAERSKFMRRIREGILLRSIIQEIRNEIPITQTTEEL